MVGELHRVWEIREVFLREVMLSWDGKKERRESGEGKRRRMLIAEGLSHAKALRQEGTGRGGRKQMRPECQCGR